MKPEYDRIAVKSIVTLISNWRTHRGGLLHEGVVPSHAVGYFVGFWAWDSWRFAAALAKFNPELARNNIRAMFDYQLPDGMIIDCIYTNPSENNGRNSKPPLACWAVDEIFTNTNDTALSGRCFRSLWHIITGGTLNATMIITVYANMVPQTVLWRLQHGRAEWTMPSDLMILQC